MSEDHAGKGYTETEIVNFDLLLQITKDLAVGRENAKLKKEIWQLAGRRWIGKEMGRNWHDVPEFTEERNGKTRRLPTEGWCDKHHTRFRKYCNEQDALVLFTHEGIFIAETEEEVARFQDQYQTPYTNGVVAANNRAVKAIEKKGFNLSLRFLNFSRLLKGGSDDDNL